MVGQFIFSSSGCWWWGWCNSVGNVIAKHYPSLACYLTNHKSSETGPWTQWVQSIPMASPVHRAGSTGAHLWCGQMGGLQQFIWWSHVNMELKEMMQHLVESTPSPCPNSSGWWKNYCARSVLLMINGLVVKYMKTKSGMISTASEGYLQCCNKIIDAVYFKKLQGNDVSAQLKINHMQTTFDLPPLKICGALHTSAV